MKKHAIILCAIVSATHLYASEANFIMQDEVYEQAQEAPQIKRGSDKEKIARDLIQQFEMGKINEGQLTTCIKSGALHGNELDVRDHRTGKALIHHAAEKGNRKLVGLIIENGGNPHLRTRSGETAEAIIKRKMLSITTYKDNKKEFNTYTGCLKSYNKATDRIVAQNKKIARQRKKELLSAIDL